MLVTCQNKKWISLVSRHWFKRPATFSAFRNESNSADTLDRMTNLKVSGRINLNPIVTRLVLNN